jgi:tetrapyrrole methylase family protein / MazG family protein
MTPSPSITVVGLGPGDASLITRGAWQAIERAEVLYLRTAVHPTVAALPPHLELRPFDALYETAAGFAQVYAQIAAELVARAEAGEPVVYAVPGHPLVAEATTRHLLALARERGVPARIVAGLSFVEPACELLGLDPLAHGLQLLDALDLVPAEGHPPPDEGASVADPSAASWASLHGHQYEPPLLPFPLAATRPALICQVYSRAVASHVKLSLMERYPPDHPVTVVRAAGVAGEERAWTVPLHELDRQEGIDHLTSLFVPALEPLADLRGAEGAGYVVARLLGPGGCPWDREQDHRSLRGALLEEVHEVLEAIDAGDEAALAEELGDLLLSVLMHAEMARQAGGFSIADVYEQVSSKLIRRHPHVFGDTEVAGSGQVLQNWEQIKRGEREAKGQAARGTLDGIPPGLPALAASQKLTSKAAKAGFDSPALADAWALLDEELAELRDAAASGEQERVEAELGDLLLAAAKLGWKLQVDAESALREAGARFRTRFELLEQRLAAEGRQLRDMTVAEKLAAWDATKRPAS